MKQYVCVLLSLPVLTGAASAKTLTYNQMTTVNMRDQGIPADERSTNVLLTRNNLVYGATSGDTCHVFRFDPKTLRITVLGTVRGPNTVVRGMVLDGDTIYVGTMLTRRQLWLRARGTDKACELEDASLVQIRGSFNTGHLYRITGIEEPDPQIQELGTPVPGQGIHTMAMDRTRGLIYGLTYPGGRFFIYDTKTDKTQQCSFGRTYTNASNHMVGMVEVAKELADLTPGEGEWNNRLVAKAMHVRADGTLYTSGWRGQILKYDPTVKDVQKRFSVVGYIPSAPGRQHWNRIDAIVEHAGKLYIGTSDGYIIRLDPKTDRMENLGKPVRAVEVMGMVFSTLDGKLYGVNGGGLEGMSRFWCCDVNKGTFEVDYPAIQVFPNRHRVGDVVCTRDGKLVMAEAVRVGNLCVLTPGQKKEWAKSGILPEMKTTDPYSPTARANASAKPVSRAGKIVGRITRPNA